MDLLQSLISPPRNESSRHRHELISKGDVHVPVLPSHKTMVNKYDVVEQIPRVIYPETGHSSMPTSAPWPDIVRSSMTAGRTQVTEAEKALPASFHVTSDEATIQQANDHTAVTSQPVGNSLMTDRPKTQTSDKICSFWYHYGTCTRNSSSATGADNPCIYKHFLNPDSSTIKLSWVLSRWHKHPCGLELCHFKNGPKRRKKDSAQSTKRSSSGMSENVDTTLTAKTTRDIEEAVTSISKTKRKRRYSHRDEPAPIPAERPKFDYDDEAGSNSSCSQGEETCFFWYHGRCSRSLDSRISYQCNYKHALTDPPSMVQPPPGYVHKSPCRLEWCPGDSMQPSVNSKSKLGHVANKPEDCSLHAEQPSSSTEQNGNDLVEDDANVKANWYLSGFEEPS